jgi:hypothetical protein
VKKFDSIPFVDIINIYSPAIYINLIPRINIEMIRQKLSILVLSSILALVLLATPSGQPQQIQPAYSQTTHCGETDFGGGVTVGRCVTTGQDPSLSDEFCQPAFGCESVEQPDISHRDAGRQTGNVHEGCARNTFETTCTVER